MLGRPMTVPSSVVRVKIPADNGIGGRVKSVEEVADCLLSVG